MQPVYSVLLGVPACLTKNWETAVWTCGHPLLVDQCESVSVWALVSCGTLRVSLVLPLILCVTLGHFTLSDQQS
uniref:Xyloside xylosyltransferase 1 n=1 Tax=Molossus molossus TaxID=27622 RepID=A0A7J8I2F1_MOLMO|nr:xyloside xylosyltransferase 1 [Molossus molossus]